LDVEDGLELRWSVAPSDFLYRGKVSATLDGKPLKVSTARGEIKDDPAFRLTEIYHREATAHVDGKDLPELGELLVTYQGCRENTVCYSPITESIDLAAFFISDEVLVSYQGCGKNEICHSPITKPE
jgi:thiol:disulfide interchange protein DsbD